jgi:hypothetical protein
MSVLFRVVFVLAGAIVALFVARDALHFDLIQTAVAILIAAAAMGVASFWTWRRRA